MQPGGNNAFTAQQLQQLQMQHLQNLQRAGLQQQQPGRTVSPAPQALAQGPHQAVLAMVQQQQQAQAQHRQQQQVLQAASLQAQAGRPARPAGALTGMASAGSAGNLAGLMAGLTGQAAAAAGLQRPNNAGLISAAAAAAAAGRPLTAGGPGILPGRPFGSAPDAVDAATKLKVQAALKAMKPSEAPRVEPPEGHEWVQCMGKDGKPGWFAVVRAKAQAMRSLSAAKRKAEEGPGGQPKKKRAADDDLVAGGGPVSMMLMDDDALEAEEAAAKGAVVVEAGNVQEEYLLNPSSTMRLVARLAKEGGVAAVSDAVYPYLSLAAETFLAQLLNNMVKMRLQREDLGRGYFGFVQGDVSLRADLYKMREQERAAAEKRAEEERDELAKMGASRKKMNEDERKAAQAARQARDLEQKKANLGPTLSLLGLGRRGFLSSAKQPTRTGTSKPGMTKPELAAVKAAAEGAAAAPAAAAAAAQDGAVVKAEPTAAAAAAAGAAPATTQPSAAAAGGPAPAAGPAPLKPMTLQHQLLSAADVSNKAAAPFVAGGVPARKARDGDDGLRDLMLADLVAVLERHPLYCRSPQLYALHTLAAMQADSMK